MLTWCRRTRRQRVVGLVLLAACRSLADPALPPDAEPMTPPAVYKTWWALTEACSGLTGAFDRVQWYQVPNASTLPYPGRTDVVAYWSLASNRIVTAGQSALDGGGVRHEMLHALVGTVGHPRAYFLEKCGGVVACTDDCIADAGPPPRADPAAPSITVDQFPPTITIAPTAASMQIDSGFFTVTVSVTNASNHPVIVALPDGKGSFLGTTFGYSIRSPFGGQISDEQPHDPGAVRFAANETKRQVFDFQVGARDFSPTAPFSTTFPPGTYSVAGKFGRDRPFTTLTTTFQP